MTSAALDAAKAGRLISRTQNALLSRIQRRYRTNSKIVRFSEVEFPFTFVADPDRVLDEIADEEDRREHAGGIRNAEPLHLPYWAELWDSASGMGQHLVDRAISLRATRVLDLGCGQGLSGCVAAALGASVLFADLETPALLFARLNGSRLSAQVRARRINWQTDSLGETFDLILGADILYERKQWDFLEPFWRRHLAPGGTILLGEPGRQSGDRFMEWIAPMGWMLRRLEVHTRVCASAIRIIEISPFVNPIAEEARIKGEEQKNARFP